MPWQFRPRLLPTMFVAGGVAVLLSLGTWQLRRLQAAGVARERFAERLAEPPFDAASPPADADLRRARVVGEPLWDRHFLIAGKYMFGGQPGYHLVVPVRVSPERHVLVDEGWIPADEVALILPNERALPSPRAWEGLARVPAKDEDAAGTFAPEEGYARKWRAVDPAAMGAVLGVVLEPWVLTEGEGLAADADIPDRTPPIGGWRTEPVQPPHGQYAATWYSLSLTLALVWVSATFRRTG